MKEILTKFRIKNAKEISSLLSSTCKIDYNENSKYVDSKFYRDLIGSSVDLISCIWLLVDLISYLIFVCLVDINSILKNHILLQSKEILDI